MPLAHTERFGDLDYSEESLILFPRGLPGFEQCRRFVLLDQPQLAPLVHLQSLENPGLCFLAAPLRGIDPEYELWVSAEDRELVPAGDPLLELTLLSVTANGQLTANLLAPVVIHLATRVAVQPVRCDTRYSHQHPLGEVPGC